MAKEQLKRQAKIRAFYVEVEGDDETIQEGLRSVAVALNRAIQPAAQNRSKLSPIATTPVQNRQDNQGQQDLFNDEQIQADQEAALDQEYEEADADVVPRKTVRPRKKRTYTVVPNLNLQQAGNESLKDYYVKKAPNGQQEQMTVFIYYLSSIMKISNITDNHVYTCFKAMDLPVPPDIPQIARNIAQRKGWIDASDGKNLRLTINGENYVEHDLPKSKSEAV